MRRTRSQGEPQLPLNPEINKTLREIKKNKGRGVTSSSSSPNRNPSVEASPFLGPQDPKTELPLVEEPQERVQDLSINPNIRSSPSGIFYPLKNLDSSSSSSYQVVKVEKEPLKNQDKVNMAEEKTLGELLAHNLQQNPGNIVIPTVQNFILNPAILNVLPVFEGHRNDNPYIHWVS